MQTSARPLWWWTLLAVAAASWIVLLLFDALRHLGVPQFAHPLFDVDTDRGAAECASYVFMLIGAASLLLVWRGRRRRAIFCVLGVFLLVVLTDDVVEIHEHVGAVLGERAGLGPIAGIGPPTLGSWAMWAGIMGPFLLAFTLTWEHSRTRVRRDALGVLRWVGVLLFFAVVVDALRPITGTYGLEWPDGVAYALKLIEFSGEYAATVGISAVGLRLVVGTRTTQRRAVPAGDRDRTPAEDRRQEYVLPDYDRSFHLQDQETYGFVPAPPPVAKEPAGTRTGSAAGRRRRRRPVTMPTDSPSR